MYVCKIIMYPFRYIYYTLFPFVVAKINYTEQFSETNSNKPYEYTDVVPIINQSTLISPIHEKKSSTFLFECCICLELISSKKYLLLSNCKHPVHISCLKQWFNENSYTCPLCRSNQTALHYRLSE